jgi:4-aminobutyrate aminotransferase/(S)-3-amino-2-methylpropionate transaminase
VVCFTGAFHGRTLLTLAMTGKTQPYKAGFGPLPGDVFHVPYPMEYRGLRADDAFAALERLFAADLAPEETAAVVIEPVLGEGGFYAAPPEFLRRLRTLCDAHGIVFVADEIQTGFARTGRMFAMEHSGVSPDLITVAKSLAGGLPLSGVIGRAQIMDAPGPGGLGGTYGGNPVACAAGLAVLDVIEREGLCARAEAAGRRIAGFLTALAARPEGRPIGDVRALGAMCAFELVSDRAARTPDAALTKALCTRARELGLIVLSCGVHGNVVRILAPLTASDAVLDEGLSILATALAQTRENT